MKELIIANSNVRRMAVDGNTAWAEQLRSFACTRRWAVISSVYRKLDVAVNLLFFKLDVRLLQR